MIRFLFSSILFVLIFISLSGVYTGHLFVLAQNTSITELTNKEKEELDEKQDKIKELQQKSDKYKKIIELKQDEQKTISTQINLLEIEAEKIEVDIERNKQEISSFSDDITTLENKISEKERFIISQRRILLELIRSYYDQNYNKDISFLFSERPLSEHMLQDDQYSQVSTKISELLSQLTALRNSLQKDHSTLITKKDEITVLTSKLIARTDYLEDTKSYKNTLLNKSESEEKKYNTKLTKVEEEREDLQREIETLEIGKLDDYNIADLPKRSDAQFIYPVPEPIRMTQGYGKTSYSNHYASGKHNGIDFGKSGNGSIFASDDGKIIATGNMGRYGYGNWIAIDHGNNLVTLYGHLSSIKVKGGDSVKRGDKIGIMGSTGNSTGTHLHFTVFVKKTFEVVNSKSVNGVKIPIGSSVDPKKYL